MRAMEIITFVCGAIAAFFVFIGLFATNGAPQEASAAAMAVAIIGIPYAITATLQRRDFLKSLSDARSMRPD